MSASLKEKPLYLIARLSKLPPLKYSNSMKRDVSEFLHA
jgi:hypothetical protein